MGRFLRGFFLSLFFITVFSSASYTRDEASHSTKARHRCTQLLREVYRQYFNELSELDIPSRERRLLQKLKTHSQLIPNSKFLVENGLFAEKYDREIRMTSFFLEQYEAWKKSLKESEIFSEEEIQDVDINLFTRSILIDGPFHPHEIFNLSLVYDNLYGSHLYQILESVEIRDLGDFLGLRRQLAMVQTAYIAQMSWKTSERNNRSLDENTRKALVEEPVYLPLDNRARIAQQTARIVGSVLPPLSRFLNDIFESIQPSTPIEPIGTELAKEFVEADWMLPTLRAFDQLLKELEFSLEHDPEFTYGGNVFDVALLASEGDKEKALILIGLMSIQRKALIRRLARHYAQAGMLHQHAEALSLSVSLYYRITEIAELIKEKEPKSVERHYQFLYPGGTKFANNKFYHFWSEAFFSYYLRAQSHSRLLVYCGLAGVGCVYEVATSIAGIRFYHAFGIPLWPSFRATRMLEDISLHRMGASWGLNLYQEMSSTD